MKTIANSPQPGARLLTLLAQAVRRSPAQTFRLRSQKETAHPPAAQLYDYAAGALARPETAAIRRHLFHCAECNRKVLYLMRLTAPFPRLVDELQQTIADWPAQATSLAQGVVTWATALWQPELAGMPVYASDIPEQEHVFAGKEGEIKLTCAWRNTLHTQPAFIQFAWLADVTVNCELVALFFNPDTKQKLAEFSLGGYFEGGKILTSEDLKFNPSQEKWAIAILLKERATT